MNNQDHLVLRLARLKNAEELDEQRGDSLIFLFSKGGIGKCTTRFAAHRLCSGDVLVWNGAIPTKLLVGDGKGEFLFWSFSVCFENMLPLFAGDEISLLHHISESFKNGKLFNASCPLAMQCHELLKLVPPQCNLDHRGQLIRIAATILSVEFKDGLDKRSGYFRSDDHLVQVFEKLSAADVNGG